MQPESLELDEVHWYLEGSLAEGRPWRMLIEPLPFLVGRSPKCNLRLASESVSRLHAEFFREQGGLFLRDLRSKNGSFINRKRVARQAELGNGDTIHFGSTEFRIRREDLAPAVEDTATLSQQTVDLQGLYGMLEEDFRLLLCQKAVIPYFQPIVRMENQSRYGYEVMGRGCYGGLPFRASELFQLAERLGSEVELSRLFWRQGILTGLKLPGKPRLFVNIHPAELAARGLVDALKKARTEAPDLGITVEISEKSITDIKRMASLKSRLAEINIDLAYDDFGSGQARFLELAEVPPNVLKFDSVLIRDIHRRPKRLYKVVQTLVAMASDLGIQALAEGIESVEEAEVCAQLGFRFGQGYHFGRPARMGSI